MKKIHPRHMDIYNWLKEKGPGEISQTAIAEALQCKRLTVRRATEALMEAGLLEVSRENDASPYYYKCKEQHS